MQNMQFSMSKSTVCGSSTMRLRRDKLWLPNLMRLIRRLEYALTPACVTWHDLVLSRTDPPPPPHYQKTQIPRLRLSSRPSVLPKIPHLHMHSQDCAAAKCRTQAPRALS